MSTKPHLSPSQLDLICKCGEAYRRRYIEREKQPPGVAMLVGTGVHAGAKANFTQKLESHKDLPQKDIIDASVAGFDAAASQGFVDDSGVDKDLVIGSSRDQVAELAELYAEEMAPEYQPAIVEQEVRVEVPNSPRDLLGIIDLADDQGRVIDFKTGKRKQQSEADHSVQLTFYAAAHAVATGEIAKEVRLEVLVKNKVPKRQLLVSTRDHSDFQALVNRANMALKIIDAGTYAPATPGAWWCGPKWCGYWKTCPYVNSERAALAEE